jgi:two-component system, sensor histidine kinase ChiS
MTSIPLGQTTIITTISLLCILACNKPPEDVIHHTFSPVVIETHGYVVPPDSITGPNVIILDESKLKRVTAGRPKVVPVLTNVHPAGTPKVVFAGTPRICTPGQDTFLLPITVAAIHSPFIAGIPEVTIVKDAYSKDQNPQNFSSFSKLEGLKTEEIRCMLQDRSGYLWFGNKGGGLCKYDGKTFTLFTEQDGLSSRYIMDMLEDRHGNLWLATQYGGVCKYDGKAFTHFKEKEGLTHNEINTILEDRQGNLWFGTNGGGLSKYDGISFTHYSEKQGLSNNVVLSIHEDRKGNLWFGTEGGGVCKFDGTSFSHFTEKEGLSNNTVSCILEDQRGNLWFGTFGGGVSKYNGKTFTHFTEKEGLSNNDILNSMKDREGNLWFATYGGGVSKYNGKSFTHFTENEGLSNNIVWDVLEDSGHNFWFGTEDGGINKYDGKSFTHFTENEGLSNNHALDILKDHEGNLWFGTNAGGVTKYDGKSFTHFSEKEGLSFNTVLSILEDRLGNLWFGTDGGGVNKYDGKSFTHFTEKDGLSNSSVMSILEDRLGNLWFGTDGGGVIKYDGSRVESVERGELISYRNRQGLRKINGRLAKSFTHFTEKEGLSTNDVSCILEDRLGNIWFGSFTGGVTKYDGNRIDAIAGGEDIPLSDQQDLRKINGKLVKSFTHFTEKEGLSNNYVSDILEDQQGNFWFATSSGVSKYDGKSFTHFTDKEGLSNNTIMSILEDRRGNLWFGTNDGLNLLTKSKLDVILSPNDVVQNEAEGSDGPDPVMNNSAMDSDVFFKHYTYEDGFLGIGCNRNSICEDNRGNIWIGTNDRITVYHPPLESETMDTSAPNIQLTGLQLFNEPISWAGFQYNKDTTFLLGNGMKAGPFRFDSLSWWFSLPVQLSLAHRNNHITFNYIGITMHQPKKVRYQYKLEGNDENWSAITSNTEAPYGNLPHGKYVFKVKAMNSNGYWSNEFHYPFTIRAPWWLTGWAYLSYIIVLSGIVLIIRREEIRKRDLEHRLELERVASEKLKEVDQLKSRFFANISHEFRTPLTLMLGQLESINSTISDELIHKKTDMATRNGHQLMDLISQVLDLSKLEAGRVELHLHKFDLVTFIRDTIQPFYTLARERNITLDMESGFSVLPVYFDPEKITRVINNLLANALKFTPPGGSIHVILGKSKPGSKTLQHSVSAVNGKEVEEVVTITVTDTGIGIPADKLEQVFDRFYQVENSGVSDSGGAGIGLAIVREVVHLHGGTVGVSSKPGEGSSFRVELPLHKGKDSLVDEDGTTEVSDGGAITELLAGQEVISNNGKDGHADLPLVLIVEDHPDMRQFISEQLREAGYRTVVAGDGEQGLEAAVNNMPELIITDIMMPRMNGLEFSRRLRIDARVSHIPVIVLTARAGEEEKIEGLLTGVDDYLTKPFSTRELHIRVANLIRIRRLLRERFSSATVIKPSEVSVVPMDQVFLDKVISSVEANLGEEDFGVEALSEAVFMSPNHLHRKLTALISQSPGQFIRSMRLQRAADLLIAHAGTVNEIAYQVGFTVPENFSRSFKKQFGVSPMEYARKGARQT